MGLAWLQFAWRSLMTHWKINHKFEQRVPVLNMRAPIRSHDHLMIGIRERLATSTGKCVFKAEAKQSISTRF